MRRIAVEHLQPGMIIARTIFSSNGFPLLAQGNPLDSAYIVKLKQMGINAIYIKSPLDDRIGFNEPISEKTRVEAVKAIKQVFKDFAKTKGFSLRAVRGHVNDIVDEALRNRHKTMDLVDIRSQNDYLYGHCVNVCVLSILTAIKMEYNELQLRDIGLGAILHDLGIVDIDPELLNKAGKLSPKEIITVRKHCELGFEELREHKEFSLLSAHVAFQHHERYNGSGYPRGLKGSSIHEYSRIVAICDVFDAMIMDRPYRRAYPPHKALKIIKESAGSLFDPEIFGLFEGIVADYPAGTFVELNSGEVGVTQSSSKGKNSLLIFLDGLKQPIQNPLEKYLDQKGKISVHRVLKENDPLINKVLTLSDS